MRLSSVLLFAVSTTAFLIAPQIDTDIIKDARWRGPSNPAVKDFIHHLLEQKSTDVELVCQSCPWQDEVHDSKIHLSFSTQDTIFSVNSYPLLPLSLARSRAQTITATLRRHDQSLEVPVNFAMEVLSPIPSPHKDGLRLLPVTFTILALDHKPVKVNTVSLKLLQPPQSGPVIVDVKQIPFERTPGTTCAEQAWSVCRFRAIVTARIQMMLEAAKHHSGKVSGWVKAKAGCHRAHGESMSHREHASHKDTESLQPSDVPHHSDHRNPSPHENRPHSHHGEHRHDRDHMYHHRAHRLSHMLHQTFRFFIIPALLGIIGGLTASALGMVVGQLVVRIYRKIQGDERGVTEYQQIIIIDEKQPEELPEYVEKLDEKC